MTKQQEKILKRVPENASPAFRQMRDLASDSSVEVIGNGPVRQTAGEASSIWSVRFHYANIRGKRFVGLASLVRSLRELPPDDVVEQIGLTRGPKTGLAFFHISSGQPLGAVLSTRTKFDNERSQQSWQTAMARHGSAHNNERERKRPGREQAPKNVAVALDANSPYSVLIRLILAYPHRRTLLLSPVSPQQL